MFNFLMVALVGLVLGISIYSGGQVIKKVNARPEVTENDVVAPTPEIIEQIEYETITSEPTPKLIATPTVVAPTKSQKIRDREEYDDRDEERGEDD